MVTLTELLPGSSSSCSSTHDHNHNHRYDVFLSFRGADTRNSFTDHLYNALLDAGINTFLDDEEIETGEPLKPELETAIKSSRASIIVLSKNYASSTWCLDELALILDQITNRKQIVIPIFYHVEPTDVRKQQGSFKEAMAKHEQRMEAETDAEKRSEWAQKIELWKMALKQVAGLKGKNAKGRKETDVIKEVVIDIHGRLVVLLSNPLPRLIGMDNYIHFIGSWLTDGSHHTVDILTVVGMGGIGKTSLARYVFGLHSIKFNKCSFIEGINRRCNEQFTGLLDLQKQLHGDISKKISLQVNDVSVYTSKIENALARKKLFIVLDDIGSLDQLDALLGNKGLHPGSKIIITTKDASLTERCALFDLPVKPKHQNVSLNGLCESESLELLCIHAFNSCKPKEGYNVVSKKLVNYCNGHPLALQVLGRSLKKENVANWEDRINGLKKEPHPDIKKALQTTIDVLPSENDKALFKHIACFFVGKDKDITETILNACDINTRSGFGNLIDRCLLSIGCDNKLIMHQLVQEIGRDLVRHESDKPWERSRVWCPKESFKVLEKKLGTKNLLGLALDMRMLEKEKSNGGSVKLTTEAFSKMDNLQLLQLNFVKINGSYKNISKELRWLCMHGFNFKLIPSELPLENLVALDMSHSNIESFDMSYGSSKQFMRRIKGLISSNSKDKQLLASLKILDLSFCQELRSIGGFFLLPALERLIVKNCIRLIKVCESIEQCAELIHIDMTYCNKLKKLPTSIGKLRKVKTLLLNGCHLCESQIKMCDMNSSSISLNSQTSSHDIMEVIHSDMKFLTTSLPSSLRMLSLANNNLTNESFPRDFSCLATLEELCLDDNPIVSMPKCVRNLTRLKKLSMNYCDKLISIEYPPRTLRVLSFACIETSLRKIKFDPEMSSLDLSCAWSVSSPWLIEVDGMLKIQALSGVEEKLLQGLGWTNLEFIKKRSLGIYILRQSNKSIQPQGRSKIIIDDSMEGPYMCYEFGIFSTIYEGNEMPSWINLLSELPLIDFIIPSSPNNLRGLNLCIVVTFSSWATHIQMLPMIEILNRTKKQSWAYYPYIEKIQFDGKCISWLSHWMFGPNEMEAGDFISIEVGKTQFAMKCGVGLVYDDGSMEEEDVLGYYKSWNHIIGGDLSPFKLSTGKYILYNGEFVGISSKTHGRYRRFRAKDRVAFQKKAKDRCHMDCC